MRMATALPAGPAAETAAGAGATPRLRTPLPVALMLVLVLMMPIEISTTLGGLFLTPAKVFLVLMSFVLIAKVGKVRLYSFDWLFILHALWSAMASFIVYGAAGAEGAGLYILEFLVVYMLVRVYMTQLGQFRGLIGLLFLLVLVSTVLAIPEALSGRRYIHEFARSLTGFRYGYTNEYRMGILRSASFFEHQILFGVFSSAMLGLVWFTSTTFQRIVRVPVIFLGTFLSASSAPLLAFAMQVILIGMEKATRKLPERVFKITLVATVLGSILQFTTGRGIFGVLALLTLNPGTAYTRRSQWQFGIDDVMRHPLFGFDPPTWTRPLWLAPSVDNNWLLMMMKSGIPAIVLLFLGLFFVWRALAQRGKDVPLLFDQLRKGWGIMILAVLFTGATVAFFGKMQPMFSLYIAIGAALAACPLPRATAQDEALQEDRTQAPARPGYTRFPARSVPRPAEGGAPSYPMGPAGEAAREDRAALRSRTSPSSKARPILTSPRA